MSILNAVLRAAVDGLLYPFRGLSPWAGLAVVSLVTALPMLLVFKATSNQQALAEVKRKIHAGLFEIRLYNDDLRAILRAQLEILRHNLGYLWLSLPPMLFIVPPLVLLFAQLEFHYGYRGLEPGEPAILEAAFSERAVEELGEARPELGLVLPAGLEQQTPPVWMPGQRRAAWRVAASQPGDYVVELRFGEDSVSKSVHAGDGVVRRSPRRVDTGLLDQLLYPAEPPLPADGPFTEVTLSYPVRTIALLGLELPWWAIYLLLLFAAILALRRAVGVTI